MPPTLVLVLCTAFVFFLLRLERKQIPDVSRTLWIPTIWMLFIASRPIGAWFQLRSANPDQGSPLDFAFQAVFILAAMAILIRRDFDWSGAIRENAWLMALIIFMLISVLWSDLPGISFKRWVKELLAILMAFVVLSERSPRRAMESILRRTIFVLIPFSPVLIKYFPDYGVLYGRWSGEQMWVGVANHKNSLACLCIISVLFLIWSIIRRWQGNNTAVWKYQTHAEILLLALTFWLLRGPGGDIFYSATSIFALSAGLLVYGGYYLAKKTKVQVSTGTLTALVTVIIVLGIASIFTGGSRLAFFASAAGRDSTLTGRTEVWTSLLPSVMSKPLAGGGFGVFWTPGRQDLYKISGAHNGYLEVLLGLGFIGIFLVSAFLLSSCRKAHRALFYDFDWGILWICYIIISVVHNVGESSIDSFTRYLTAIILFTTVSSTNIIQTGGRTNGV